MVFEKVAKIIADYADKDVCEIKPETKLVEDLALDSLDTIELIMSLEEEFQVSIEEEVSLQTVGDVAAYIERIMQ